MRLEYEALDIERLATTRNLTDYFRLRAKYAEAHGKDPAEIDTAVETFRALLVDSPDGPPKAESMIILPDELESARLHPDAIVDKYLYADIAVDAAPGGTGKTTRKLYEMVCIALERPLYGLEIRKSGWCLFVTAEDRREYLIARLREIMKAMELTDDERLKVFAFVRIWDVTGEPQKLVTVIDGNITLTTLADDIISQYCDKPPVLIVFDPLVSFGASEGMTNDNEQALIMAGRRIIKALNCCVQFIAHTGKQNAADKNLTQYASRGGSALSDGSRMFTVSQTWTEDCTQTLPPGCTADPDSSITMLNRPKLSYAPPNQPLIFIKRTGFAFEWFTEQKISKEDKQRNLLDQVVRFLESECKAGAKHSKTTLESAMLEQVTRKDFRQAFNILFSRGQIIETELPKEEQKTRRKTYLIPAGFGGIPKTDDNSGHPKPPSNNAAALRENNGGIIPAAHFPPVSNDAVNNRQDSAALAGLPLNPPFTRGQS